MIKPRDLVYHLGDVYFGKKGSSLIACNNYPDRKYLLKEIMIERIRSGIWIMALYPC